MEPMNQRKLAFLPRLIICVAGYLSVFPAHATYQTTGYVTDLEIDMDNGVTYFRGFTTLGNCTYNRLELRDTGDYFGSVENGRRIYALILSARLSGKAVNLGYNDTDGPNCRVAEVWIQW